MTSVRKQKLFWILFTLVILSLVAALVLYALRQNINLFYTPTQIAHGEAPLQRHIKIGGMVLPGSVIRHANSLIVEFQLTDFKQKILVNYQGILPDLFKEGQGIVAEGRVTQNGQFQATQVLAKHDENYMPQEVRAALRSQPQKVNS